MVNINKSKVIVILLILLVIGSLAWLVYAGVKKDNESLRKDTDAVNSMGVKTSKSECVKAGIQPKDCESITGTTSTTECNGRGCWIVSVSTKNTDIYGASMTVEKQNGKFEITDYLRNNGDHIDIGSTN